MALCRLFKPLLPCSTDLVASIIALDCSIDGMICLRVYSLRRSDGQKSAKRIFTVVNRANKFMVAAIFVGQLVDRVKFWAISGCPEVML
jgi:hypothetical protein